MLTRSTLPVATAATAVSFVIVMTAIRRMSKTMLENVVVRIPRTLLGCCARQSQSDKPYTAETNSPLYDSKPESRERNSKL